MCRSVCVIGLKRLCLDESLLPYCILSVGVEVNQDVYIKKNLTYVDFLLLCVVFVCENICNDYLCTLIWRNVTLSINQVAGGVA